MLAEGGPEEGVLEGILVAPEPDNDMTANSYLFTADLESSEVLHEARRETHTTALGTAQNCALSPSFYCESHDRSRTLLHLDAGHLLRALIAVLLVVGLPASAATTGSSSTQAANPMPATHSGRVSGVASGTRPEEQSPSRLAKHPLKILVFGDSISAAYGIDRKLGWANLLQQRLARTYPRAQVINGSVSGETTQGGRARLQAALDRHNPQLVFVELGGNDALRGYPVKRMRDNLTAMVTMAQSSGARVVLLGMQIPPNYGPRYTRDFAAAFKTVAAATEAHLVPFFLDGVALVEGMIQGDGIHPTAAAQPTLLATGWDALVDCLALDYPLLVSDSKQAGSEATAGAN